MTLPFLRGLVLAVCIVFLSGCSGYDRVLFVTKTNVGLDIDTEPPTAEVTIARREIAIQPTFPNNDTKENKDNDESGLPLLAAFGLTGSFFNPSITAHFAGGDAAVNLSPGDKTKPVNSSLCLSKEPEDPRGLLLKLWHLITFQDYQKIKEEPRPFYFATDTSYGVKVAWSGTAGPYPDSLKLGYNRKEFASPPIFVDAIKSCKLKGSKDGFKVKMPSFYASIDNAGGYTTLTESGVKHVQFFATGEAATRFAEDPYVQEIAFSQMAPAAAKLKANKIGLNRDLIDEIGAKWNPADGAKRDKILKESVRLELVETGTKEDQFMAMLKERSKLLLPEFSKNLNVLRRFAIDL
ncbi:MAG: hypothetical protein NPIRA05_05810 [Nitrospirales bacterium]|nr:MAG: hypothetical protein NPIRA05_05810 [Nitrospirales bacterium]